MHKNFLLVLLFLIGFLFMVHTVVSPGGEDPGGVERTCSDGDGGDVPTVNGTCTRQYYTRYADSCSSGTSLTEYYCSGYVCTSKVYDCNSYCISAGYVSGSCSSGACVCVSGTTGTTGTTAATNTTPITPPPSLPRKVVFISKYSSRSMDSVTYEYYKKLESKYTAENISIIQDSKVLTADSSWSEAVNTNDLFFVTSLSDAALGVNKTEFCSNLATALKKTKGIVFAGNSSAYISSSVYGCLYTSYFDFATAANNQQTGSSVKIVKLHPITSDYDLKNYSLSQPSVIYTTRAPRMDGVGLANAAQYPFLVIWENMTYRVATWGIENPSSECSGCLGWKLFNRMLDWTSNVEDMGVKIDFSKAVYGVGETLNVGVRSPVNVKSVAGKIIYPNEKEYDLTFFGSGKTWNATYPLLSTDPTGEYTVSLTADEGQKTAKVKVKVFKLDIKILNRTDGANILIDVFDFNGNLLSSVTLDVKITYPSDKRVVYGFVSNQTVSVNFTSTESGKYTLVVSGTDTANRTDSETVDFWIVKPNILNVTVDPDSISEVVEAPVNLSQSIDIKNIGNVNITTVIVSKFGDVAPWIKILNDTLPDIAKNGSSKLYFNINVPAVNEGKYNGSVRISAQEGIKEIPIEIRVKLKSDISITPSSWSEFVILGNKVSKEFVLENRGSKNLTVGDVSFDGDIEDIEPEVTKPDEILVGAKEKMKMVIDTSDLRLTKSSRTYAGDVVLEIGSLEKTIPVNITVVKDLTQELQSLQSTLSEIEVDVSKLSQSTLAESDIESKLVNARDSLDEVKELYASEKYADALDKYDSLVADVDDLGEETLRLQQLEQDKNKTPQLLMNVILIAFASILAFTGIIWYVNRKSVGDKYAWLYGKYSK